ncbi:hypothetical protein KY331_06460 [Candidatus Woesearchaeota archaeon]|nr:hypothetical protein [Candidatus Woesearchaeota archaeon]
MSISKKAMTLSINSLVVIIISLVILSLGIVLMRTFFKGTAELKAKIDSQTETKIASLLAEGEPLAIPVNRKTIEAKQHSTFGLGILNIYQDSPEKRFYINIIASGAYDRTNTEILGVNFQDWLLWDEEPLTLLANEQEIIPILIAVSADAVPGTYIFTVDVTADGSPYGKHKIYVEVP